jgi:hypothetical protein
MKIQPKLLPLNLQYFAEDGGAENPSAETKNTEKSADEIMIPKSRFDEVNAKYKEAKTGYESLIAEKEQAEVKSQEEQGKYQELYEKTTKDLDGFKSQFETADTRVKELEGVIEELYKSKLVAVPEDYHDLIPDHLSVEQKLSWIEKAEAKGMFGNLKSDKPVGDATNPSPKQSIDLNNMNSMQLLSMGFNKKK